MTGEKMENYRLEKEYKVPAELFKEAYLAFQKKYVYPKSYVFMGLFIAIAVGMLIFGIFTSEETSKKQKYIIYLAFVIASAFAFREWYTPKKMRRNITESVKALGEPVYKIGVSDSFVDISTVSDDLSDIPEEERETVHDTDPLPEKTRLNKNKELEILEYDRFFLILSGKTMFYILPKEGFSESELEILRSLSSEK